MTPLDSLHLEIFLGIFWEFFIFLNSNLKFEFGPVSYRTEPEPVRKPRLPVKPVWTGSGSGRFQTGPNSNFKFELKNKNSQKISKNTSSCDESNGVKFFQIFVHLVYFAGI